MTPALDYLKITGAVEAIISDHAGNDRSRAAYLIMRAALLHCEPSKVRKSPPAKPFNLPTR